MESNRAQHNVSFGNVSHTSSRHATELHSPEHHAGKSAGSVHLFALTSLLVVAGFSTAMYVQPAGSTNNQDAHKERLDSELIMAAEAGLNYSYLWLENDPLYAVKESDLFRYHPEKGEFVSESLAIEGLGKQAGLRFSFRVSYERDGSPVAFEDLLKSERLFDSVRVTCRASKSGNSLSRAYTTVYVVPLKHEHSALYSSHMQSTPLAESSLSQPSTASTSGL